LISSCITNTPDRSQMMSKVVHLLQQWSHKLGYTVYTHYLRFQGLFQITCTWRYQKFERNKICLRNN